MVQIQLASPMSMNVKIKDLLALSTLWFSALTPLAAFTVAIVPWATLAMDSIARTSTSAWSTTADAVSIHLYLV